MRSSALCLPLIVAFVSACDPSDTPDPNVAEVAEVADIALAEADATLADVDVAIDTTPDDVAIEVTPDPCTPNPCTEPPLATCSFDRRTATLPASEGACTNNAGAATCTYPSTVETCDVEGFCSLGECLYIGSICDYPVEGIWAYATGTYVAGQSADKDPETGLPVDECCFDLDGDGTIDNAYGAGARTIEAFLGTSLNDFVNGQIQAMIANSLVQVRGLPADAPAHPSGRFDLFGLGATELEGTTYEVAAAGDGAFRVNPTGFLENTSLPRTHYELVVDNGVIISGFGAFGLPAGVGNRNIDMEFAAIEGTLTYDPARGVTLDHADGQGLRIATLITQSEWLAVWNSHAREFCTCTTFPDDNAYDIATATCNAPLDVACEETDSICKVITDPVLCNVLIDLLKPDIDRDGDGKKESISAGLRIKSVPARVLPGITNCP